MYISLSNNHGRYNMAELLKQINGVLVAVLVLEIENSKVNK